MLLSIMQQTNPDAFLGYLLLAYAAMWVIALVYVLSLLVQQRNMRRDITLLKQLIEEEEGSDG